MMKFSDAASRTKTARLSSNRSRQRTRTLQLDYGDVFIRAAQE
jgi:hypothetical protein